jgi:hypothetical protein
MSPARDREKLVEALIEPLRSLDWEDVDAVEHATRKALTVLSEETTHVRGALLALPERPDLLGLCEHRDTLDEIAIYHDESGVGVALHVFMSGYSARPHNHCWTFASTILRGGYRHSLSGNAELEEAIGPASRKALQVRQEHAGGAYALHHAMMHAVVAKPGTVSLVLRGPPVKDRFLVTDCDAAASWRHRGDAGPEPAGSAAQPMSVERLARLTRQLRDWDLF